MLHSISIMKIGRFLISRGADVRYSSGNLVRADRLIVQINIRDKANQHPLSVLYFLRKCWTLSREFASVRHRAATTGSTGFVTLLLRPPEGSPKTRLNTGDRNGTFSFCVKQAVSWLKSDGTKGTLRYTLLWNLRMARQLPCSSKLVQTGRA